MYERHERSWRFRVFRTFRGYRVPNTFAPNLNSTRSACSSWLMPEVTPGSPVIHEAAATFCAPGRSPPYTAGNAEHGIGNAEHRRHPFRNPQSSFRIPQLSPQRLGEQSGHDLRNVSKEGFAVTFDFASPICGILAP